MDMRDCATTQSYFHLNQIVIIHLRYVQYYVILLTFEYYKQREKGVEIVDHDPPAAVRKHTNALKIARVRLRRLKALITNNPFGNKFSLARLFVS